jgi:hypothetical protein
MQNTIYSGKPVCTVHFNREAGARGGLVTAAKQAPKGALKLTGLPVPGAPGYRPGPVSAAAARKIAECQPGGAIIVWQGDEKSREFAHVYSRPAKVAT